MKLSLRKMEIKKRKMRKKMNKNKSHISMVIDRSGSMSSLWAEANGGIKSFIDKQKECVGTASLSIFDFDDTFEEKVNLNNIRDFTSYDLIPRGMTALYDSVCKAINLTGQRLAALPEDERPGLVLFMVVTDGQENSSREFSKERMVEMVKHQTDKYNWQFTFLCADPTTANVAKSAGADALSIDQSIRTSAMYDMSAGKFSRMRSAVAKGMDVVNLYSTEELKEMDIEDDQTNRPIV